MGKIPPSPSYYVIFYCDLDLVFYFRFLRPLRLLVSNRLPKSPSASIRLINCLIRTPLSPVSICLIKSRG